MAELDYLKEFNSGNITITRCDYENAPAPMDTSSLSDNDMQKIVEAINYEMDRWNDWLKNGDINQDQYDEHLWETIEYYGNAFGMTYYEDYDE